jgi:hypothetical protein
VVFVLPTRRAPAYERRRPEDTILYQVVQQHLETFLAEGRQRTPLNRACRDGRAPGALAPATSADPRLGEGGAAREDRLC